MTFNELFFSSHGLAKKVSTLVLHIQLKLALGMREHVKLYC